MGCIVANKFTTNGDDDFCTHLLEVNLLNLMIIQLPTFAYTGSLNKPYVNEVYLTGQNLKSYS